MIELYYDNPTQVKYYDPDLDLNAIGIAIGDKLITCDGQYVDISFVIDNAKLKNITADDAIIELSWKTLD